MKIYNSVTIDIDTGEILHEDSFEYDGPVAQCGSGGGPDMQTVDPVYNARMATIAEEQLKMGREYFEYWKDEYQPLERDQIAMQRRLMPYQEGYERLALEHDTKGLGEEEKQWAFDERSRQHQTLQMEAAEELLPYQTEYQKGIMNASMQEIQAGQPLAAEFYKQALEGVNVHDRVSTARADVGLGFADAEEANRRAQARMGVAPGSNKSQYLNTATGIEKAKAIGGAMTGARVQAQDEEFARLATATQLNTQRARGIM